MFRDAGEHASRRLIEFFTVTIRNRNTREAYGRAVRDFCDWCEVRKIGLSEISPFLVAEYVEELGTQIDRPSVKQKLAAIKMLFDWLVTGQILPVNPAAAVRGPKHVVTVGRTPVLTAEEARQLLDAIDTSTIAGKRDRALIATMLYTFARIGAVTSMDIEDYEIRYELPRDTLPKVWLRRNRMYLQAVLRCWWFIRESCMQPVTCGVELTSHDQCFGPGFRGSIKRAFDGASVRADRAGLRSHQTIANQPSHQLVELRAIISWSQFTQSFLQLEGRHQSRATRKQIEDQKLKSGQIWQNRHSRSWFQ